MALGPLSRHRAGPGGRTVGSGGVTLRESHARGGQLVEVRSLVVGGTLHPEIGPAEVVGVDIDNVGPVLTRGQERE